MFIELKWEISSVKFLRILLEIKGVGKEYDKGNEQSIRFLEE